ncbi:restriction endonuclease subunit S [Flavitalea flava]
MIDTIIQSFDIWTDAQGVKSKGRVKSIDNISLEGIARLRGLILDLAIRGKLITQDLNDEPTSELIRKIEKEKDKLIKEGRIKKQSSLDKVEKDEKLFELPESWKWVRLGEIGIGSTGKTPSTGVSKYFDGEIPFIGPGQINPDGKITESDKTLTDLGAQMSTLADAGDILMVCIGGSIGKSAIVMSKTAFNQQINCIRPILIETSFLNIAFNSPYFQRTILEKATGSATPIINRGKWEELPIPLAPIFAQKRIVAKVDELMALCDKLEEKQINNLKTHQLLVKNLLVILTRAKGADELRTTWQQLSTHFDTLFCTEDSIDQLKKTILQLAIIGRLVKQNSEDEPAAVLLERIKAEKNKLIIEGKLKKEKDLPPITKNEIAFELAKGWVWCRLADVGILKRGKSKHRPRNDKRLFIDGSYPFIQTGEVSLAKKNGGLINSINGYYNEFGLKQSEMQQAGTLCITIAANIAEYGFLSFDSCVPDSIVCFNSIDSVISYYMSYFIDVSKDMLEKFAPSTAQKNINLGILTELKFPLPPLEEQKRIVARVKELMKLCDELKDKIIKSQEIQGFLSKTIVENAIA